MISFMLYKKPHTREIAAAQLVGEVDVHQRDMAHVPASLSRTDF